MFIIEKPLQVVAAHRCYVCKSEGSLLCLSCADEVCPMLPSRCYKCHVSVAGATVCKSCRARSPLKQVWIATNYNGVVKRLVHDFKFQRAQAAAIAMAEIICQRLPDIDRPLLVIPVPTATYRQRQRGYDHAALLARQVAARLDMPFAPLLRRMGQSRQVGADRHTRLQQLSGAFRLVKARHVVGANVLIVDDIVTTGASLESVAHMLKAAGAAWVGAVAFAQKQ